MSKKKSKNDIERVYEIVAKTFRLSDPLDLEIPTKNKSLTEPRYAAVFLLKSEFSVPADVIAVRFGWDERQVYRAFDKALALRNSDKAFKIKIERMRKVLILS